MVDAGAWSETPVLAFLNRQVRNILLRSGVEWHEFDAPGLPGPAGYYAVGPRTADEPIVLVHGLADSAHTWLRVMRPLGTLRRVYAVTLPGHAWTPAPEKGWASIRENADFLEAFRRRVLDGHSFTLVGHSLGGWVGAKYAARRPEGLERLVLVESAGLAYDGMEEQVALLRIETARDVERLWRTALHRVPWALRLFNGEVATLYRSPVVRGLIENWEPEDVLQDDELRRIAARTTIVWGREDGLTPPHLAERLLELVPDARIEWMEDCGHGPQLEKPLELLEVIRRALRDAPSADVAREPGSAVAGASWPATVRGPGP